MDDNGHGETVSPECVQEAVADQARFVRTIVGAGEVSFCPSDYSCQLKVKAGGRGRVPSSRDPLPPDATAICNTHAEVPPQDDIGVYLLHYICRRFRFAELLGSRGTECLAVPPRFRRSLAPLTYLQFSNLALLAIWTHHVIASSLHTASRFVAVSRMSIVGFSVTPASTAD